MILDLSAEAIAKEDFRFMISSIAIYHLAAVKFFVLLCEIILNGSL